MNKHTYFGERMRYVCLILVLLVFFLVTNGSWPQNILGKPSSQANDEDLSQSCKQEQASKDCDKTLDKLVQLFPNAFMLATQNPEFAEKLIDLIQKDDAQLERKVENQIDQDPNAKTVVRKRTVRVRKLPKDAVRPPRPKPTPTPTPSSEGEGGSDGCPTGEIRSDDGNCYPAPPPGWTP